MFYTILYFYFNFQFIWLYILQTTKFLIAQGQDFFRLLMIFMHLIYLEVYWLISFIVMWFIYRYPLWLSCCGMFFFYIVPLSCLYTMYINISVHVFNFLHDYVLFALCILYTHFFSIGFLPLIHVYEYLILFQRCVHTNILSQYQICKEQGKKTLLNLTNSFFVFFYIAYDNI